MEKKCSKCGNEKLLEEFHRKPGGKFGVRSICAMCANEYAGKYRHDNQDLINEKARKWRYKHREKVQKYDKLRRSTDEHRKRAQEWAVSRLIAWSQYFAQSIPEPTCGVCGRILQYYPEGNRDTYVCWDHCKGITTKIKSPSHWLQSHAPSTKNIRRFESEEFRILCPSCNFRIPTDLGLRTGLLNYLKETLNVQA